MITVTASRNDKSSNIIHNLPVGQINSNGTYADISFHYPIKQMQCIHTETNTQRHVHPCSVTV